MGYDIGRFKEVVNDELICAICTGVLKDPVMAPKCEHAFCRVCISDWLHEKQQCPMDVTTLRVEDLIPIQRIVRNMLSKLLISCDHASNGCTLFVKLEELDFHAKQCKYNPTQELPCKEGFGMPNTKNGVDNHNCVQELRKCLDAVTQDLEVERKRCQEIQETLMKSNQELRQEVNQLKVSLELTKNEMHGLNQSLRIARVQKAQEDENNLSGDWFEKIPFNFYNLSDLKRGLYIKKFAKFLSAHKCPVKDWDKFVLCRCEEFTHECGIEKLENFNLIVRRDDYESGHSSTRVCLILKSDNINVPSELIPKCGFACCVDDQFQLKLKIKKKYACFYTPEQCLAELIIFIEK